jgi:hypothetical protein
MSGAAWLPSTQVGQLTLLDGSSVEVAAQVRAVRRQRSPAGHRGDIFAASRRRAASLDSWLSDQEE